uniref:asparagine--tRNA ligase n=1 Tax=Arion vulgaris TaxID=1028688 RepID=A0A0B6ZW05_9EUPU
MAFIKYSIRTTRVINFYIHFRKQYSTKNIKQILLDQKTGQATCVKGWVKGIQQHKGVTFLHVGDGSGPQHIQIIIPQELAEATKVTFGSCVEVQGVLKESPATGQSVELLSTFVNVVGPCNSLEFPLKPKTRHPPQYTRDFLHVRPKTNVFSALLRIRNVASMAVHSFFQGQNYVFIHTPILTSSDCEGACEVFKVEPLKNDIMSSDSPDEDEIGYEPGKNIISGEIRPASVQEDSSFNHFFKRPSFLTVSGQLHLEVMTGAFTKVYNFGPVFRAEGSCGSFHLSEFYMVEAEIAFINKLENLQIVMEHLIKFVFKSVLDECPEDFALFLKYVAPSKHMSNINSIMESKFERLSYTDAIHILENSNEDFQFKSFWGCDLKKEHEIYLTKAVGNIPAFVTDYPAHIKPFYARRNEDTLTVAASDLLVPGIGELCGSSLREERADILEEIMTNKGLMNEIPWSA